MRITVTALSLALGLTVGAPRCADSDGHPRSLAIRLGRPAATTLSSAPTSSCRTYGYLEQEFFFEGTANTYAAAQPGAHAEIATRGTPYRSRLLVRRPAQQARFNGTVIVEWFNVTNGYDTDVLWLYQKEFLIREGYAWVGVSAQNVGVARPPNGLRVWSPARYGTLDVDGGGKVTGDALGVRHLFPGRCGGARSAGRARRAALRASHRGRAVAVGGPARDLLQRYPRPGADLRRGAADGQHHADSR